MRMLAFAGLVFLGGCNDQVRVVSFTADPAGTFVFTAQTNTVMTANDDGEAEQFGATGSPTSSAPMECALPDTSSKSGVSWSRRTRHPLTRTTSSIPGAVFNPTRRANAR